MATILIVDDSPVDRRLAGSLLSKRPILEVAYAANGQEALTLIGQTLPDLVLTDLQMPDLNGLELVEEIRHRYPKLPVILMTGQGSEDIAIQALQKGAASYVPKRNLAQDLLETVENVLGAAGAKQRHQRLLDECWLQSETHFLLGNDTSLIPPLISHLQENLTRMHLCDENGLIRVAVALREAITNAIHHGNLEASAELRAKDEKAYQKLIAERSQQEPYEDRQVHIIVRETRAEASYTISDEGPGFDLSVLPDPGDPASLETSTGRGLVLIRTFMDEVTHNQRGNEITMIKRRDH